ncbi:MAG: hypothetical protein [Olavius algarvensis Gamma 1 endosymbiont]|nr:MAG: hypothetical protein [Olavius algarvensis Gamma 1 endosymbiont]
MWVKKRGKWLILSVGIIPYGNIWHASYVRRCLSLPAREARSARRVVRGRRRRERLAEVAKGP